MPYDTLSPRLQAVAKAGQKYLTDRFGKTGLKLETEIDAEIGWRPTIQVRPNGTLIVAAEVSESLFPSALKIAAIDVLRFDFPISMFLLCPLDVYLADNGQKTTSQLRRHGFGVMTADDSGKIVVQSPCIPLAQFISEEETASGLARLPIKVKIAFRGALETYRTNEGQGLQQSGQIVEAIVRCLADGAAKENLISAPPPGKALADVIDDLYAVTQFKAHRAALGGARAFVKTYRNVASHPATSPKLAIDKIRKCKSGVMDALKHSKDLVTVIEARGYAMKIVVT